METTITDIIINSLKKAVVELEELQVQVALGKADAKDKYVGAKKRYNEFLHRAKLHLDKTEKISKEKIDLFKVAFDELRLELALGKAETKDFLEEQKKKILKIVRQFETNGNK